MGEIPEGNEQKSFELESEAIPRQVSERNSKRDRERASERLANRSESQNKQCCLIF